MRRPPRLPRAPALRWGLALSTALLLLAAAAPWLAPYDPAEILDPALTQNRPPGTALPAIHRSDGSWELAERVERVADGLLVERSGPVERLPAAAVRNLTPSGVADRRRFLLGTDRFGRDVWSRLLWGARVSLGVGLGSALLALTLGVAVGAAAALAGGVLSFPMLFALIALSAFLKPGPAVMVLLFGLTAWMGISRLARAEIQSLEQREFVLAARALGRHPLAVFCRHLLPNALTPVLIQATLLIGMTILVESSLSFLGLGIQPPTPSWGNMVAEGRDQIPEAWWIATFPGAAISLTVIAFNLLGDGLRDALDPRGRDLGPLAPADATLPPR